MKIKFFEKLFNKSSRLGHLVNISPFNQFLFRNKFYTTGVSKVANAIPKLTPKTLQSKNITWKKPS